eukprot:TRINITY_DN386_c0_g1_i5.p5 TRINITY_DN386_c0_g1~~TRINITY_DN386_c0_g1_i5.p5  ORF type:complete len:174 (-),score=26.82 TRINITY_DN386_c0_g1_i5:869-1390(-)
MLFGMCTKKKKKKQSLFPKSIDRSDCKKKKKKIKKKKKKKKKNMLNPPFVPKGLIPPSEGWLECLGIRRFKTLVGFTGRKAFVGSSQKFVVKAQSPTLEQQCFEIELQFGGSRRNSDIRSEMPQIVGGTLEAKALCWANTDTQKRKLGKQKELDNPDQLLHTREQMVEGVLLN